MKTNILWGNNRSHNYIIIAVIAILILILGWLCFRVFHADNAVSASTTSRTGRPSQQVTVASVSSLSPENASLSVIGQVTSENEATILSQTAGEIVSLNKSLGDHVAAGETIATIENSSQQAAVLQAQGAYNAAVANFNETSGTTVQNLDVTSTQANENAQNAEDAAAASTHDAYLKVQNALNNDSDILFANPQSVNPIINIFTTDQTLKDTIDNERLILNEKLAAMGTISEDDFSTQAQAIASGTLNYAKKFITDLAVITSDLSVGNSALSQNQITTDNTAVNAAAVEVNAGISEYVNAQIAYNSAIAGATTATNSANGATSGNVALASANEQAALGALNAAQAALYKTIIRSPISGNIISLPVTTGDYIPSFSEVAQVSNPGSLKIITHVSAQDASTLSIGNTAIINNNIPGVITEVAPAIDPETGTIEVDVGLTGNQTGLIDGDSATVNLNRSVASVISADSSADASSTVSIIIPIVALKITPTGPVVFVVNHASTTSVLSLHPVQIGSILGENIVVTQGLTPSMQIVTDARGLTNGEIVSVKK